jgi:hypothetical protein
MAIVPPWVILQLQSSLFPKISSRVFQEFNVHQIYKSKSG